MNAVEIEEMVSALAKRPFDANEFPFALLQALGNKRTTIKWLRSRASNRSDVDVVAAYKLYNINKGRLEKLIHRIFASARLEIEIKDRSGNPVMP